jgi:integrase/recombinase XerD
MVNATKLTAVAAVPLRDLADSRLRSLDAEHKSRATLAAYKAGIDGFLAWHTGKYPAAEPVLDKATATAYITDLRRAGRRPATCRLRHVALTRFADWLAEEGETDGDVLDRMRPPRLDKPVIEHLTDDEMAALVKACRGPEFADRRDEALVRLMGEAGLRAGEALALTTDDIDVGRGLVRVVRGKGGKGRVVPFGADTGKALDRYLRMRRRHPRQHEKALWLPAGGRPSFGYTGLALALKSRAKAAGVEGFHCHRLRHTAAVNWLRSGRSPLALRSIGGWADLSMVGLYSESNAAAQAIEEARRTDLPPLGRF